MYLTAFRPREDTEVQYPWRPGVSIGTAHGQASTAAGVSKC